MTITLDWRAEEKLKERAPLIAVIVSFATLGLMGLLLIVAVVATQPL